MENETREMSLSEKLTYSTVLIKCTNTDGTCCTGTGFIVELCRDGDKCKPVIITNNHVVADALSIELEFCKKDEFDMPNDLETIKIHVDQCSWIKHPDSNVDLCCMLFGPIVNVLNQRNMKIFYTSIDIGLIPSKEDCNNFRALEEMVMIGYPIGLMDHYNHKPIIRRGTTATHYKNNYQGKKEFLLDMACFPGSSGSPIFLIKEGGYTMNNGFYSGNYLRFAGILYAGPQYNAQGNIVAYANPGFVSNTQIPTNLGVAIKSERVLEFENVIKNI